MTQNPLKLAILIPIASVVVVVALGGGLGVLFIGLDKAGAGEWGAVIIGIALVVGVPAVAFLLQQRFEKNETG